MCILAYVKTVEGEIKYRHQKILFKEKSYLVKNPILGSEE